MDGGGVRRNRLSRRSTMPRNFHERIAIYAAIVPPLRVLRKSLYGHDRPEAIAGLNITGVCSCR